MNKSLEEFKELARQHLPGRTDNYLECRFYLMTLFESQYDPEVHGDDMAEYMCQRLDAYDSIGLK